MWRLLWHLQLGVRMSQAPSPVIEGSPLSLLGRLRDCEDGKTRSILANTAV